MSKFHSDATRLLAAVGGRDNINAITHCVTRLRFVLQEPQRADVAAIEALASVKGTFTQSGQFQVIIGNEVSEFYKEFTALAGLEGVSKDAVKAAASSQQNLFQRLMSALGEIFAPLIPALICGGLILGFRNLIGEIQLFDGKTLAQTAPFWAGLYDFLWLIGEAVFHMLPIGIVWSITRKMGTTPILGIVLGATLVSPQLLNAFTVAGTAPADIPVWDFGFTKVNRIGYQGQVIAAILAGFVLVYLERFFRRISPAVISMIVVPFCSLVPAVLIAHVFVGPLGWKIGTAIADAVYGGLTSPWSVLFAALFGFLYAPVVMTGLHHMTNAVDMTLTTKFGGTILWPMIALSNIAQGSSVLAMAVLQRHNQRAAQVNVPACISAYLGVTEPALFGVNMKYGFPLLCGMVGSALAAMVSIGFGVQALSIGVGGIPGILSINPRFWLAFLLAMAVAIAVPFTLSYLVGRRRLATEAPAAVDTDAAFVAPLSGTLVPLEALTDQAFASGSMGAGIAIDPSDGRVIAPVSGTVEVVFPSGHAYGLSDGQGRELLIHIGMDTVELQGAGFTSHVRQGQRVRQGDLLAEVDLPLLRSRGKNPITPVVFTNGEALRLLKTSGPVRAGEGGILDFDGAES